jgi:Histidine-specific methyltransferase, SAM-dependent
MKTYKNIEISKKFKVSLPTVNRWIENSLEGKNLLKLEIIKDKHRIIQNSHNDDIMNQLQEAGVINKNKVFVSTVKPEDEFYKVFSEDQVYDIISNLKNRKDIPLKYTYMNGGASIWAKISNGDPTTDLSKAFLVTPELLKMLQEYLISVGVNKKFNIIDLGPGNGVNTKRLVSFLNKNNILNKYLAVDISKEMLGFVRSNMQKWFPKVKYGEFILDFESSDLAPLTRREKDSDVINLILLIGNTFGNVQDEIRLFKNLEFSLEEEDLLIFSNRLEGHNELTNWEHIAGNNERHIFIPKLLGINVEKSRFLLQYSDKIKSRVASIVLDRDYVIEFNNGDQVNLHKNDEIMVWHHKMTSKQDLNSILQLCDLEIACYATSPDMSHYICACKRG